MHKFKKIGIVGVALFLVLYVLSSFIQADLDCFKWSSKSRIVMCGWWVVFFIYWLICNIESIED
jgi:hypothetical protein